MVNLKHLVAVRSSRSIVCIPLHSTGPSVHIWPHDISKIFPAVAVCEIEPTDLHTLLEKTAPNRRLRISCYARVDGTTQNFCFQTACLEEKASIS